MIAYCMRMYERGEYKTDSNRIEVTMYLKETTARFITITVI